MYIVNVPEGETEVLLRIVPKIEPPAPAREMRGMDVSKWQGRVEWALVRKSVPLIEFAYIRATMGATRIDEQFIRNWGEAKKAGVPRGAYHYFVQDVAGDAQARNFLDALNGDIGEWRPVVDIEPRKLESGEYEKPANKAAVSAQVRVWLQAVQAATGKAPIIYTNRWALEWLTDSPAWLGDYALWVAAYRAAPPTNAMLPTPWATRGYAGWQYTREGKVLGVEGNVDLDAWRAGG